MPTPDSRTAVTVLETDGAPTAALLHDPALLEDPGLVAAVAAALRLTVENQRLQGEVERQLDEVRASRVRIVEAADAERRAVERDLHDGAQQRLVSIDLSLQLLRAHTAEMDHSSIDASIERASDELRTAIKELRLLTHGVHPALLRDAGIGPALQSLADRSGLPVVLTADVPNRLSPVVEATVYFVASESLANAAKHAQASVAHVAVGVDGSTIVVDVRDDGRGGADPSAGSGLRGLQDRVAALGGSLRVESPVGGGTTVRASVPFA